VSTVGTPVMSMIAIGRAGLDDLLQDVFHHHLGARGIEGADQRQRQDAVPQLHDRVDSSSSSCCWRTMIWSRARWNTSIVYRPSWSSSELMVQDGVGEPRVIAGKARVQAREQRLLEREHEGGGFARGRAVLGAGRGDLGQQVAHFVPRTVLDVIQLTTAGAAGKGGQELLAMLAQLLLRDHVRAERQRFQLRQPLGTDLGLVFLNDLADAGRVVLGGHRSVLTFWKL
jgi:hypothetical protein